MGIEAPPYSEFLLRTDEGYKISEDAPQEVKEILQKWINAFMKGDNIFSKERE